MSALSVEELGRRIIDDCLGGGGSVLTPGQSIWTLENLAELKRDFVDRPDMGTGDFWAKLDTQPGDTSSATIQLFAELFIVNLLPLADYHADTKIRSIERVLQKCDPAVTVPGDVQSALSGGVYRGGMAFKTRRWSQMMLLVKFAQHFQELSADHYGDPTVDVAATYGLDAIRRRLQAKVARAEIDSDDADPTDAD